MNTFIAFSKKTDDLIEIAIYRPDSREGVAPVFSRVHRWGGSTPESFLASVENALLLLGKGFHETWEEDQRIAAPMAWAIAKGHNVPFIHSQDISKEAAAELYERLSKWIAEGKSNDQWPSVVSRFEQVLKAA